MVKWVLWSIEIMCSTWEPIKPTYLYLWKANKTHILITQSGILFNLDHIEGFYLSFDGGDCSLKIIGHELMTEVVSKM